ncbi:MAG: propanediol utilization protein [Bacilli bacterium]|nr:propanediol utilization protein [Bacilli bacterium]
MKVILGISNRHVHLTEEDYKILFGNEPLNKVKDLVQPGQFSSDKKVSIKTEKRTIDNVRLLGPLRSYTQVEVSKTDSFSLGIDPPVRNSGDLEGAAVVTIVGPMGEVTKPCCIIANRHLHINPAQRRELGLVGIDKINAKWVGEKTTIFEDVYIKESEDYTLELHLDTDDGNGALAKTGEEIEIFIP